MDVGLLIRFGRPVPGRETQGIELFEEVIAYFRGKLEEGTITFFEPFLMRTSDLVEESGFFLVKGPAPAMFALMEDEAYHRFMEKGTLLAEHLRADMLMVGDAITTEMEIGAKVRAELGI